MNDGRTIMLSHKWESKLEKAFVYRQLIKSGAIKETEMDIE